jgi:hypothetical protein
MMMNQVKARRPKVNAASGVKALISVSALAGTLIGWGILGRQELVRDGSAPAPVSNTDAISQILGPLPTLVPQTASTIGQKTSEEPASSPNLRTVTLPTRSSSRPGPVTRTQSSR